MAKDNSSVAWDCQLNAIHRGNSLIYSLAFLSSRWAFAMFFLTSGGCTSCPEVTLWQLFLSQQVRHCRAVIVPSARSQDSGSVPPGPGRWEKCCVPRTSMNCHLEPASQHPVPTFPLSCKAVGPAVQIQEVCATCGSDVCCLILSWRSPKPWTKFLNHYFPSNLVKQVRILVGEKVGVLCALAVTETSKSFSN